MKNENQDPFQVGNGATVSLWSDCLAGTIIKRTAKTMVIQEDDAQLMNRDEAIVQEGGFTAHWSWPKGQKYEYKPNPNGRIFKATMHRDGKWYADGSSTANVSAGRNKYHDYNF